MPQKVIIYTTPVCVYCRMAKSFFRVRGVPFEERDVLKDLTARKEMLEKSGAKSVPVIDIGGEIIVGFHRERLREILREI